VGSSNRTKQVRTLIVNGAAAAHAQLHQLCADRPELEAIVEPEVSSAPDEASQPLPEVNGGFLREPVHPPSFGAIRAPARSLWPPHIVGERSGSIYFLDIGAVEYVESAGNYVVAHLGANGYLTRATLKTLAQQLTPLGFIQIERSLLVNLRQVDHVERRERGQYCFVMRSGAHLVSSRERHGSIQALLQSAMTPGRV